MSDRDDILKNFSKNDDFLELSGLTKEDIEKLGFAADSNGNVLTEALKTMIDSYCEEKGLK